MRVAWRGMARRSDCSRLFMRRMARHEIKQLVRRVGGCRFSGLWYVPLLT
jgi:hypothetical protein